MSKKLPIAGIFFGAYALLFSRVSEFVRRLALPALMFTALMVSAVIGVFDGGSMMATYVFVFAVLIVSTLASVSVHRIVLLGTDSVPRFGRAVPTKREAKFLLLVVIGYASIALLSLLFSNVQFKTLTSNTTASAAFVVVLMGWLYLVSRLLLLLPATALDRMPDPRRAWRISRGNGWRLFLLLIVFPALSAIILGTVADPPLEWVAARLGWELIATLGWMVVHAPIFVAEIIMLSLTYQVLCKQDTGSGHIVRS